MYGFRSGIFFEGSVWNKKIGDQSTVITADRDHEGADEMTTNSLGEATQPATLQPAH